LQRRQRAEHRRQRAADDIGVQISVHTQTEKNEHGTEQDETYKAMRLPAKELIRESAMVPLTCCTDMVLQKYQTPHSYGRGKTSKSYKNCRFDMQKLKL
jgi:hypothetical protein